MSIAFLKRYVNELGSKLRINRHLCCAHTANNVLATSTMHLLKPGEAEGK